MANVFDGVEESRVLGGRYAPPHAAESVDDDADYAVDGHIIRFMPDDTVTVPLWDGSGLLPDDAEWLNRALGLSRNLVADIAVWGKAWNAPTLWVHRDGERYRQHFAQLAQEADRLVARLRATLPEGYEVDDLRL